MQKKKKEEDKMEKEEEEMKKEEDKKKKEEDKMKMKEKEMKKEEEEIPGANIAPPPKHDVSQYFSKARSLFAHNQGESTKFSRG